MLEPRSYVRSKHLFLRPDLPPHRRRAQAVSNSPLLQRRDRSHAQPPLFRGGEHGEDPQFDTAEHGATITARRGSTPPHAAPQAKQTGTATAILSRLENRHHLRHDLVQYRARQHIHPASTPRPHHQKPPLPMREPPAPAANLNPAKPTPHPQTPRHKRQRARPPIHVPMFDQSACSSVPTCHNPGSRAQALSNSPPYAAGPEPRAAPLQGRACRGPTI